MFPLRQLTFDATQSKSIFMRNRAFQLFGKYYPPLT